MRNIFAQYKQYENRLTHALSCALNSDRDLLKSFMDDLVEIPSPESDSLHVIEQSLPNRSKALEVFLHETEEKGLPDAVIFDNSGWSLIIESKISSPICQDQLIRHCKTLESKNFQNPNVLVIAPSSKELELQNCKVITWSSVYRWGSQFYKSSFWAKELVNYFEILEKEMIEDGYLCNETITDFTGIPFNSENPITYQKGKIVLKQLLSSVRKRKKLSPCLNVDYESSGRGAITNQSVIWDIIPIINKKGSSSFVDALHFTFCLSAQSLQLHLTIPDKISSQIKKSLTGFDTELERFTTNLQLLKIKKEEYKPKVKLIQRHYASRRSVPSIDGILEFDLRTLFPEKHSSVKKQSGWLDSIKTLYMNKSSNLQLQVGVELTYELLSRLQTDKNLELIEATCNSMVGLVKIFNENILPKEVGATRT